MHRLFFAGQPCCFLQGVGVRDAGRHPYGNHCVLKQPTMSSSPKMRWRSGAEHLSDRWMDQFRRREQRVILARLLAQQPLLLLPHDVCRSANDFTLLFVSVD